MKRLLIATITAYAMFLITSCSGCRDKKEARLAEEARKEKRSNIGTEKTDSIAIEQFITARPEFKKYRKKMLKFYGRRDYALSWSQNGELIPQADMLLNVIPNLEAEGIKLSDNDVKNLRALHNKIKEEEGMPDSSAYASRVEIDFLLSSSYFKYSKSLWSGKVNPEDEEISWFVSKKKIQYGKTLDQLLEEGSKIDNATFVMKGKLHPQYHNLKQMLENYRALEKKGGWPQISMETKQLALNDSSATVIKLRERLLISGDLKSNNRSPVYDSELENSVKNFQRRHGLQEDGKLSAKTLSALNVPVAERIVQLLINMERWRWVPPIESKDYLMVNIPEYRLHIYENNKDAWDMAVIVGKTGHTTPIFNDDIEFVVMSPYWNVTKSIAVNEIVPELQRNPGSLAAQNMEMFRVGDSKNPLSPYDVDWGSVDKEKFPYWFRQKPGPKNSLGWVKFVFPNEYEVYLHDTPTDYLFTQNDRGFSHGCIRLEKPVELAQYLLRDAPGWTPDKVYREIHTGVEKHVKLEKKVPVYIVYFTTWMDKNGQYNFRNDVYNHDQKLAKAYFGE